MKDGCGCGHLSFQHCGRRRGRTKTGGVACWPVSLTILINEFQAHWKTLSQKKKKLKNMNRDWSQCGLLANMYTCIHVYTHIQHTYMHNRNFKMRSVPIAFVCVLTREAGSQVSSLPELMKVRTDLGIWILLVSSPFYSYSSFGVLIYFHSIRVLNALKKKHLDLNAKPEVGQRMSNSWEIL